MLSLEYDGIARFLGGRIHLTILGAHVRASQIHASVMSHSRCRVAIGFSINVVRCQCMAWFASNRRLISGAARCGLIPCGIGSLMLSFKKTSLSLTNRCTSCTSNVAPTSTESSKSRIGRFFWQASGLSEITDLLWPQGREHKFCKILVSGHCLSQRGALRHIVLCSRGALEVVEHEAGPAS
jgi:hypothetical protein